MNKTERPEFESEGMLFNGSATTTIATRSSLSLSLSLSLSSSAVIKKNKENELIPALLSSTTVKNISTTTNKNTKIVYLPLHLFVGLAGLLLLYSDSKFLKPITKIANNDNKDSSKDNNSLGNISHPSYSEKNNITTLFPSKYHNNSTITTTTTTNSTINSSELCSFVEPPPVFLNYTPTPIWIPFYPGSGSDMFRDLVIATTGLGGDNHYANKCSKEPIPFTCKTHWHVIRRYRKIQPQTMVGRFHDKAMFLIRNPRHALPSYFNHEYEVKHKLKRHS